MTDLEFAKVYGWYVLRFKNLLGNQNHKPFRKLQDVKNYIARVFCAAQIEDPVREMHIEFCQYSDEVHKSLDFPCGNRLLIWIGYIDGAACLECVKEVKGLGR